MSLQKRILPIYPENPFLNTEVSNATKWKPHPNKMRFSEMWSEAGWLGLIPLFIFQAHYQHHRSVGDHLFGFEFYAAGNIATLQQAVAERVGDIVVRLGFATKAQVESCF